MSYCMYEFIEKDINFSLKKGRSFMNRSSKIWLHSLLLVGLASQVSVSFLRADDYCSSGRTISVSRSETTNQTNDLALGNYHFYHHSVCPEDRAFFHIQASYFHKQSRNDCELGSYFLPNCQNCISVKEDGDGDVGSLWANLISEQGSKFSSDYCLNPNRKIDGGFFNFYWDFNSWLCGSWVSVAFAAMRVNQGLGVCETNVKNLGTLEGFQTATEAFNNGDWEVGRLNPCNMCATGVDDIQFKAGWNYYFCNQDHLGLYFVATAPTGTKCDDIYLFQPRVGTRHGSVGIGLNADWTAWECDCQGLNWMTDVKYRYVLSACENRLFDLCENGSFSRYLQVVSPDERSNSKPGVNYFNECVNVTPGSTLELWTALHYYYCEFNFEVGYNLFWRQCEKVCLPCAKDLGVGIWDMAGDCSGDPTSSSEANISTTVTGAGTNVAASDPNFVTLTTADFNLISGSAPQALSNELYGAVSYNSEVWCMPVMLGLVGSYEFAQCNSTVEQWGAYVKGAVSF